MLSEYEEGKRKLTKELDESAKQISTLMAENAQVKKNLSKAKEKASNDDSAKSDLRKEIIESKQIITALKSEKEQLKSDLNTEMRRYVHVIDV